MVSFNKRIFMDIKGKSSTPPSQNNCLNKGSTIHNSSHLSIFFGLDHLAVQKKKVYDTECLMHSNFGMERVHGKKKRSVGKSMYTTVYTGYNSSHGLTNYSWSFCAPVGDHDDELEGH